MESLINDLSQSAGWGGVLLFATPSLLLIVVLIKAVRTHTKKSHKISAIGCGFISFVISYGLIFAGSAIWSVLEPKLNYAPGIAGVMFGWIPAIAIGAISTISRLKNN